MNRGWVAVLLGLVSAILPAEPGLASSIAATEVEVPVLFPEQEKVVYLPIEGTSVKVEEVRQKEVHGILRFVKKEGLMASPSITSAMDPEVYLQVEPLLMQEVQKEACSQKVEVSPEALLMEAQARFQTGDTAGAREKLEIARNALPCWQERAGRAFAAELLVWSGLASEDPTSDEAVGWMRAGLSTDPLLVESPKLPDEAGRRLRDVYAEMEYLPQVDLHLPQGNSGVWGHENLILNGRRLVMDKLFLQLPPGIHFLQVVMPDGQLWGAFLDLQQGGNRELVAVARDAFQLPDRYREQLARLLDEGRASPGLLQGFKVYAIKLARDAFYLAAITLEGEQPWITIRRYHIDRGIEIPEVEALRVDGGYTASAPVVLTSPWSLDVSAAYSALLGSDPAYLSHGSGVEINLTYKVMGAFRLSLFGGIQGRLYRLASEDDRGDTVADADPTLGATVGWQIPLGPKASLRPELGYAAHLNRFRGLPVPCVAQDSGYTTFDCSAAYQDYPESVVFNLRAKGSGPVARLSFAAAPIGGGALTLRMLFRVGYSPLLVHLPDTTTVMVTIEDAAGSPETTSADIALDAGSQFRVLHQMMGSVGLQGTY